MTTRVIGGPTHVIGGNTSMCPAVNCSETDGASTPSSYYLWKGAFSRVLAAFLMVPAVPILLLSAVLIRLTSKGPAIYCQTRVGKEGRHFTLFKLRTMQLDAEHATGPIWATSHDPRVTRFGRFLRAFHMDELPQLLNVVRGEMDLVGPRPERPEFVQWLIREVPGYGDRLRVRPGITGLAQLNLPPDSDVDSVREKLAFDRVYIERASLMVDLTLLLATLGPLRASMLARLETQ